MDDARRVGRQERCYGIIGDALNPVIDALHCNGKVECDRTLSLAKQAIHGNLDDVIDTAQDNILLA